MPDPPKIPVYRNPERPHSKRAAGTMNSKETKEMQEKKRKILMDLQGKMRAVSDLLNKAEYMKAFKMAVAVLEKYTVNTIENQPILTRIMAMAGTALEYLDAMNSSDDDMFLEFLGRQMEDFRPLPLFKTIERIMVDRLNKRMQSMRNDGHGKVIRPWLDSWNPWVELINHEKHVERFLSGEPIKFKWKFTIPIEFAPGERQEKIELRKELLHRIDLKEGGKDIPLVPKEPDEPPPPDPSLFEPIPPPVPIIRKSKISGTGVFSKKKETTGVEPTVEPTKKKRPKRKKTTELSSEKKDKEHSLKSSEVKAYLYKLKYEEGVNEVHYQKIKIDLGVVSLNKAKKLFRILKRFDEKGYVLRKRGSRYAILF